MLTLEEFRLRYPEFDEVDSGYVESKLEDARCRLDASVWGKVEDEGHGLLTAHLLANSPLGNAAKLDFTKTGFSTVYERDFKALQKTVTAGLRSI